MSTIPTLWTRLCKAFEEHNRKDKIVQATLGTVYVAYESLMAGNSLRPVAVCLLPFLAEKAAGFDGSVLVEQAVLIRIQEHNQFAVTQPPATVVAFLDDYGPFEVQEASYQDLEQERKAIAERAIAKLSAVELDALGIKGGRS